MGRSGDFVLTPRLVITVIALTVRGENSNASLQSFKWPGFFFGIGIGAQWPAIRVGGVQPPRNQVVYVSFNPGIATSARIVLTEPAGNIVSTSCPASPCAVTVDRNQGSPWFTIQYLSGTNAVLAQTDPDLLAVAP